jgi:hypothetical protein
MVVAPSIDFDVNSHFSQAFYCASGFGKIHPVSRLQIPNSRSKPALHTLESGMENLESIRTALLRNPMRAAD